MFKHIIKVTFILLVGSVNIMADSDFYLRIGLMHQETSKDSNSQKYMLEVDNKEVNYRFRYSGYPGNSFKSKEYTLTDKELQELIQQIKDRKINKSIKERRSTKSNGASTISVHLSVSLVLDGKITKSEISGNSRIFRADGKIKGEIITNKNYIDTVESLSQELER